MSDHPFRILIVGDSGKFNLKNQLPDIDKIYLHAKHPCKSKYQFLSEKLESTGLKYSNDYKAFIWYWNDMDDIYKTIGLCYQRHQSWLFKNIIQLKNVKY